MDALDVVNQNLILWDLQDREERREKASKNSFWATDAYVKKEDFHDGKCARAIYYTWKNEKVTNPPDHRSLRVLQLGKLIESQEIGYYRRSGILIASNTKWRCPEDKVSGEIDALIYNGRKIIGVELKSSYGWYFQQQVFGTKNKDGFPKKDHVIQVMMYIHYTDIREFNLIYFDRGDMDSTKFSIILDIVGHPVVTGVPIKSGSITMPFTVEDVKKHFINLYSNVVENKLPARDYYIEYPAEEVEKRHSSGDISETAYQDWSKKKRILGDWRCSYCSYLDACKRDGE